MQRLITGLAVVVALAAACADGTSPDPEPWGAWEFFADQNHVVLWEGTLILEPDGGRFDLMWAGQRLQGDLGSVAFEGAEARFRFEPPEPLVFFVAHEGRLHRDSITGDFTFECRPSAVGDCEMTPGPHGTFRAYRERFE